MNAIITEQRAAPLVAAAMGRAQGVKIYYGSTTIPYTNGKGIFLPLLPLELPERASKLLWGFTVHEGMHLRHTDFSVADIIASEDDPLLKSLENIFEDVRGETAQISMYPGAARILREMVEVLVETQFFAVPSANPSPASLVCGFLVRELRSTVLGQAALGVQADLYRDLLTDVIGPRFVTRFLAIASEVVNAGDTMDCLNLAYRVRQFLDDEQQDLQQPPSTSGGDGASPGAGNPSQDGSAQGSDPSDSPGGSPNSPDDGFASSGTGGEPEPNDGDASPGSSASKPGDPSDPSSADGSGADNPQGKFLKRVLSPKSGDITPDCSDLGEGLGKLLAQEIDASPDRKIAIPSSHIDVHAERDTNAISESRQISSRLSLQLKRLLEGRRRQPTQLHKRGKKISRRHLHRVALNDPRIFRRSVFVKAVNTDAILILDASSSMKKTIGNGSSARRIEVARQAVLATSLGLDAIRDLNVMASAFPGSRSDQFIDVLKGFSERTETVSSRFSLDGKRQTPLPEALLWAMNEFACRPKGRRRILVVATDGEPQDVPSSKKLVEMCEQSGIEVYFLGIETNSVHKLCKRSEVISSVNELCPALLALFSRVLSKTA